MKIQKYIKKTIKTATFITFISLNTRQEKGRIKTKSKSEDNECFVCNPRE